MKYIERPNPEGGTGCIFVDLPAQNLDEENLILDRGTTAFVMLNRFPYTNGHLMVIPFQHTAELSDLSDPELLEVNQLLARTVEWLKAAFRPQGFNIGVNLGAVAGAGIPDHIHWHVVPRWGGDTNFMTAVAGTRVHPVSLEETYRRLKEVIASS